MSERPVIKVNGKNVSFVKGAVWFEHGSSEVHVVGEVDEASVGATVARAAAMRERLRREVVAVDWFAAEERATR